MNSTARAAAIASALLACSEQTPSTKRPPVGSDSGVPTTSSPSTSTSSTSARVTSAACSLASDNALRFTCEVTLDTEGVACVDATPEDEASRTWCASTPALAHTLTVSLLPEGQNVLWQAYASTSPQEIVSGALNTGALPDALAFDVVSGTGEPNNATWITGYMGCDEQLVVVLDPQRRVVWYERIPGLNAHRWTEEHELLSLARHDTVERRGLDGVPTWTYVESNPNVALHHDVLPWQGWVFALHARLDDTLTSVITDGVTIIDATGSRHDRWELADWVAPTRTPPPFIAAYWWGNFPIGSIDWYHTNGMAMTSRDELIVSARHQSTVVAMRAEPHHAQAGEVLWHVVGSEQSAIPAGMSLEGAEGITASFVGQHYPSLVQDDDDALLIFDNLGEVTSRALQLDLDRELETATVSAEWSLPTVCETQGSIAHIGGSSFLIACGGSWYEADRAMGVTASQTLRCRDPKRSALMRGRVVPWTPPTP